MEKKEILIRRARASDVSYLAKLERETFPIAQTERDFENMLDASDRVLLVAESGRRVLGYVGAYSVCGETDILTIAVDPDVRRMGIGKKLLDALLTELDPDNDAVYLEVRESNEAARTLYTSLGFTEIGVRRGYYRFPTEDAVLYKKELH